MIVTDTSWSPSPVPAFAPVHRHFHISFPGLLAGEFIFDTIERVVEKATTRLTIKDLSL